MPRPYSIKASPVATERELDEEYNQQKRRDDEALREYGPIEGRNRILEENVEMLIERLNRYERYADAVERWRKKAKSRYTLLDKREKAPSEP